MKYTPRPTVADRHRKAQAVQREYELDCSHLTYTMACSLPSNGRQSQSSNTNRMYYQRQFQIFNYAVSSRGEKEAMPSIRKLCDKSVAVDGHAPEILNAQCFECRSGD